MSFAGVAVRLGGVLGRRRGVALIVMFSGSTVRLGRLFVVVCGFCVSGLGHYVSSCKLIDDAARCVSSAAYFELPVVPSVPFDIELAFALHEVRSYVWETTCVRDPLDGR